MERFTKQEIDRLNKILSVEINPYLMDEGEPFGLPLGEKTQEWLFETRLNLPADIKTELQEINFDSLPHKVRVHILNEILEERHVSSAPKWWELNFFEASVPDLWEFFIEQCRNNYDDKEIQAFFDLCVSSLEELNEARHILRVNKVNQDKYTEEKVQAAFETFDRSYPLDFADYDEVPQKIRSPLGALQYFISEELADLNSVFSKRWFEFKILDELASYTSYIHESARDSELSKKIARQLRGYMFGQILALGRMIEHYRWKFSHEEDALKGIQSMLANQARGKKGGEASEKSKRENLDCLMVELEGLADLFPRMSEDAIFSQAYANAGKKRKMPRSQKTIDDYGIFLRSEEPYKTRYQTIFQKNA